MFTLMNTIVKRLTARVLAFFSLRKEDDEARIESPSNGYTFNGSNTLPPRVILAILRSAFPTGSTAALTAFGISSIFGASTSLLTRFATMVNAIQRVPSIVKSASTRILSIVAKVFAGKGRVNSVIEEHAVLPRFVTDLPLRPTHLAILPPLPARVTPSAAPLIVVTPPDDEAEPLSVTSSPSPPSTRVVTPTEMDAPVLAELSSPEVFCLFPLLPPTETLQSGDGGECNVSPTETSPEASSLDSTVPPQTEMLQPGDGGAGHDSNISTAEDSRLEVPAPPPLSRPPPGVSVAELAASISARSKWSDFPAEVPVLNCLGNGGYGSVWRIVWGDETAALKVVTTPGDGDEEGVNDFYNEVNALRGSKHNNVLALKWWFRGERHSFIVTELAQLGDLRQFLRTRALSPRDVVGVALELLGALGRVHIGGHVHLDLKTANIFVKERPDGSRSVVIGDFGLARNVFLEGFPTKAIGTPGWMAPEVVRGEEHGATADLYGLGLILYSLVSGHDLSGAIWSRLCRLGDKHGVDVGIDFHERYLSEIAALGAHGSWFLQDDGAWSSPFAMRMASVIGVLCNADPEERDVTAAFAELVRLHIEVAPKAQWDYLDGPLLT